MPILYNLRTSLPLPDVPLKIKHTHHNTGALEQRAARNPPDPHQLPSHLLVRETHGSLSQCVRHKKGESPFPL
eukprot:1146824-Pelagomonas_calceolata.AAC.1